MKIYIVYMPVDYTYAKFFGTFLDPKKAEECRIENSVDEDGDAQEVLIEEQEIL